jgi:hypothetical protein
MAQQNRPVTDQHLHRLGWALTLLSWKRLAVVALLLVDIAAAIAVFRYNVQRLAVVFVPCGVSIGVLGAVQLGVLCYMRALPRTIRARGMMFLWGAGLLQVLGGVFWALASRGSADGFATAAGWAFGISLMLEEVDAGDLVGAVSAKTGVAEIHEARKRLGPVTFRGLVAGWFMFCLVLLLTLAIWLVLKTIRIRVTGLLAVGTTFVLVAVVAAYMVVHTVWAWRILSRSLRAWALLRRLAIRLSCATEEDVRRAQDGAPQGAVAGTENKVRERGNVDGAGD